MDMHPNQLVRLLKRVDAYPAPICVTNGDLRMTCLQTCSFKRKASNGQARRRDLSRIFAQSFSDLWVAVLYASLGGLAALAIEASDGGLPTLAMWVLYTVAPPFTACMLIVLDTLLRTGAEQR